LGRVKVVGVGNTLFRDDGVGYYVARALMECSETDAEVAVVETLDTTAVGLLEGADVVIFVDAADPSAASAPKVVTLDWPTTKESLGELRGEAFDPHNMSPLSLAAMAYLTGDFAGQVYFLLIPAHDISMGFGLSEETAEMAIGSATLLVRLVESAGASIRLNGDCYASKIGSLKAHQGPSP